jgi:hypothetical protein
VDGPTDARVDTEENLRVQDITLVYQPRWCTKTTQFLTYRD